MPVTPAARSASYWQDCPRHGRARVGSADPSDDRPHHRGDAHHDHHTSGRRPRVPPCRGSAGEQPQERQHRAAQAPPDRLHRGVRLGQELAGLRHHRGGVAADDQRDLQRVRAGLHAHPRATRRRPPRGPHHGDHRRPGADGRQPALHGRHRHRRQRDAADPLQQARRPVRRPADGVLLQRPDPQGERDDDHREGRPHRAPDRQAGGLPRRHVPALRGHGQGQRHRPHGALRRGQVALRRCADGARLLDGRVVRPAVRGHGPADGQADQVVHEEAARDDAVGRADQDQGRGGQPDLQRDHPADPEVHALQGPRGDAAAHPSLRGAGGHLPDLPRLRRHPPDAGGPEVEDQRQVDRRPVRDADQRPRRLGARPRRAVGGATAEGPAAPARLVLRDRPGLPLARPAGRHPVGRRGPAHQDDPPPRVVAHRRHLRLRRADDRAAPARHRADEQPAPAAARQGQHRARRGAQARDHRHRRPRGRHRSRGRSSGREHLLRGRCRRPSQERHDHRQAPRRPRPAQGVGAGAVRDDGGAGGQHAQPARRGRRRPARPADRGHRSRRVGQELADPRLAAPAATRSSSSTRARSRGHAGATPRPTPGCWIRSARRSPRPTASSPRSSAPTPRAPARPATAPA